MWFHFILNYFKNIALFENRTPKSHWLGKNVSYLFCIYL
ncbi:Hypothetical protein BN2458_PEG1568 [Helicobacter typhlonius]|uniref:Uncharacterized protein n=1 Tax=Helicobacter typhlonius TaxID=76936 RepID=A0A0S4PVY5_9HELI|nr:Hypothetical protein BN2458_PEG1568 [Helicobacter typhlonius]